MAEQLSDQNDPVFIAHLTDDNIILEQVGVVEDLNGIFFEMDDEENWQWEYQEDE